MTAPLIAPNPEQIVVLAKSEHGKWIYLTASVSALCAAVIFLVGIIASHSAGNWLMVIFRLHAGSSGAQMGQLHRLNVPDLVLLGLVAATYVGLYLALHTNHRILAAIATVQPLLGILLFLLTHNAGRSAVMGAGLVVSLAMLRGGPFSKWVAWTGLVSSALLLAGDLGTSLAPCTPLAIAAGLGYVLLVSWLLLVSRRLFQLAR